MGRLLRGRGDATASGLPDGALRLGIIHYNTADEVDRLLAGLARPRLAMLRLYWARNDGMGGHVFLGLEDLERLRRR